MQNAIEILKTLERPIRVSTGVRPRVAKEVVSCVPIPNNKVSPVLRAAAERVRQMGFASHFGDVDGPACFIGSMSYVLDLAHHAGMGSPRYKLWLEANCFVEDLIFDGHAQGFAVRALERQGWNELDAAAALDMAADYAEEIGR